MNTIKAIGWDLDDTLYQRRDFYRLAFNNMQAHVSSINASFESFYRVFEQASDIEYERFIREGKTKDQYQIDRVIATYKHFGRTLTQDEAIIFNALYFYYREHLSIDKSVSNLFDYLLKAGYEMFIITNGPSIDQRKKLNALNIEQWIPEHRWFISEELNYSKPDSEIFTHVQNKLDYQSHELAFIGDNFANDVLGANAVGWTGIYYHHPNNNGAKQKYAQTIRHLDELFAYF